MLLWTECLCPSNSFVEAQVELGPLGGDRFLRGQEGGVTMMGLMSFEEKEETFELLLPTL